MKSISHGRPPDNQNEGDPSDKASQFMAEPPAGLVSFLASMVTWAQLKTIVILIQLVTFARAMFFHCKVMVTWVELMTLAAMIQLVTIAWTTFCRLRAKLMTLIKFCCSIFDIATDIIQGKGKIQKLHLPIFKIYLPLLLKDSLESNITCSRLNHQVESLIGV